MCNEPVYDQRVLEALEARRSGGADGALPEGNVKQCLEGDPKWKDLQHRIEQADAQIGAALHEVPIPGGLHARILDALAATGVRQSERPRRVGRRRWLAAGGLAALAASVFVALWVGAPQRGPLSENLLLDGACRRFLSEQEADRAAGQLLSEVDPPESFAMSRAVARVPGLRWRMMGALLGQRAAAFDFPADGRHLATLYVLPVASAEVARTRPAANPVQSTGGVCVSAWREGDRLYVLVVRGDARAYRRLIYAPSGPLT